MITLHSLLESNRPLVMGILNVTPDSFSDGGRFLDPARAVEQGMRMIDEGADIIDVGGESTRPGAEPVSAPEECRRISSVVSALRARTDLPVSIDTTKAAVAELAIEAGATMVNDVSAGSDAGMFPLVARHRAPICLMHMRGSPRTMQLDVAYDDVAAEVRAALGRAAEAAIAAGVSRGNIVVDPGIGFGKSPQDNVLLLQRLDAFASLGFPVLVGTSRKSFIEKLLGHPLHERLEATLASMALAYARGAQLFRVHDVAAARRFLDATALFSWSDA